MTYGEWKALGLPVQWSIFLYDYTNDNDTDPDDRELDLRASGVEDGEYDGYYPFPYWMDMPVAAPHPMGVAENPFRPEMVLAGITVKKGLFVPEPTAEVIYDLIRPTETDRFGNKRKDGDEIHSKYVEKCQYNPFGDYFAIQCGS